MALVGTRECLQLEPGQDVNQATRSVIAGRSLIKACCDASLSLQLIAGTLDVITFFVRFFVIRNRYEAIFLAWKYGLGSSLRNLGPHVARIIGPVGEH